PCSIGVAERDRLRMLAKGVAGHHGVAVAACAFQQGRTKLNDPVKHTQQPVTLVDPPGNYTDVAGAPADVNTAADALAQLLDQILLTGMETTAYFQPHPLDSFLFHFTEGREHLCAVRDAEDSLLREHNQMCL